MGICSTDNPDTNAWNLMDINEIHTTNILSRTENNGAKGYNTCNCDFPFNTHEGIRLITEAIVSTVSDQKLLGKFICNKSPLATVETAVENTPTKVSHM